MPEETILKLQLTKSCSVDVALSGTVTQESVTRLIEFFEWEKAAFPTQAELDQKRDETSC
jgi:hypothetical protein